MITKTGSIKSSHTLKKQQAETEPETTRSIANFFKISFYENIYS